MGITSQQIMIVGDPASPIAISNGLLNLRFPILAPADRTLLYSVETWKVISVIYTSNVAGTDAGAVTAQLTKCTGIVAPASGVVLLTAAIDLKTAANATVPGVLISNQSTLTFAATDRLALDVTGVTTAVDGFFTISYQKV